MRYFVGLVAGCVIGLGLAASVAVAGTREDCEQTRDHDLTIRACSEIIGRDRRAAWAYGNRGGAYREKGDYDRALADLDEALRLNPHNVITLSERGVAYRMKGDYDRSLADLNEALRLNPRDAYSLRERGNVYLMRSDYDRAITELNQAIGLEPRNASAYASRGAAYRSKSEYERAIADLNEAIRLNPRNAYAYGQRGSVYRVRGDYDRAIADLNEAIRIDPRRTFAYRERGAAYEAKGDQAKAREDYDKAGMPQLTLRPDPVLPVYKTPDLAAKPPIAPPTPAPVASLERPAPAAPAVAQLGRRVALVIGNAGYKVGPLQNPSKDATAVAEALEKRLNFDRVTLKLNLGFDGFRAALREFAREAAGAGLALVYFAGHGTEVAGKNFLIPVDAALAKAGDLNLEAIALDTVLEQLAGVTTLKLVILDACRSNIFPLAGATRSTSRGLSRVEPDENTLVIYAARDGTTADDGAGGRHSPFTAALLKHIATPGLEIQYLFREVRDDVLAATAKKQQPHVYGTLGRTKIFLRP